MKKRILILGLMCVMHLPILGCEKNQQDQKTIEQLEKEIDQLRRELGEKMKELKAMKPKKENPLEDFKNLKPTPHKGF